MAHLALASISTTRILLGSPLGFLIGLSLGALGGGGSILAVPALVYVVGQSPKGATTTSLIVVGAAALIGMIGHYRGGRVRVKAGLAFGLAGLGGSLLGSELNKLVPGNILLLAFAGLMAVVGRRMWSSGRADTAAAGRPEPVAARALRDPGAIRAARDRVGLPVRAMALREPLLAGAGAGGRAPGLTLGPGGGAAERERTGRSGGMSCAVPGDRSRAEGGVAAPPAARGRNLTNLRVLLVGTIVGFLTGFFGVGGGFVIVPGLVLALGYEMPVAVGTSLLVIVVSSLEGLAFRLGGAAIDWRVAIPFAAVSILGVVFGNLVAGRVPAAKLNRWFVWLLVALAIYTAAESLTKLL
jgi:uncharacterized membrane protein YfcA